MFGLRLLWFGLRVVQRHSLEVVNSSLTMICVFERKVLPVDNVLELPPLSSNLAGTPAPAPVSPSNVGCAATPKKSAQPLMLDRLINLSIKSSRVAASSHERRISSKRCAMLYLHPRLVPFCCFATSFSQTCSASAGRLLKGTNRKREVSNCRMGCITSVSMKSSIMRRKWLEGCRNFSVLRSSGPR